MQARNRLRLGLLIVATLTALSFSSRPESPASTTRNAPQKKRAPRFYQGVPPKQITYRATITSQNPTPVLELPSVLQGDEVICSLRVENSSSKPLDLINPKSCCGILITARTHTIPPGGTGTIETLIFTDKLGGKRLDGIVETKTSDLKRPVIRQRIIMPVKKVADISSHKLILKGTAEEKITASCQIVPAPDAPFHITGLKTRKGLHIACTLKKEPEGFLLQVKNVRTRPGSYRDIVYLQTDHPHRPELKIRVQGTIQ